MTQELILVARTGVGVDETIIAIYEHGVLRPLTPLDLPEHTRVEITIRIEDRAAEHRRKVREALRAAGLLAETLPPVSRTPPLSPERREELAQRFGQGKPLSEIIIEDREGR